MGATPWLILLLVSICLLLWWILSEPKATDAWNDEEWSNEANELLWNAYKQGTVSREQHSRLLQYTFDVTDEAEFNSFCAELEEQQRLFHIGAAK